MHKFQTFLAVVSLTLLLALVLCSIVVRLNPNFMTSNIPVTFFPPASIALIVCAIILSMNHVLFYSHPYPEIHVLAASSAIVGILGVTGRIENVSTAAGFVVIVIGVGFSIWGAGAFFQNKLQKSESRVIHFCVRVMNAVKKVIFYGSGFALLSLALVCAVQTFLLARDGMYQLMTIVGILTVVLAGLGMLIVRSLVELLLKKRK